MKYNIALFLLLTATISSWSQNDTIEILDTIYLTDQQLKSFNTGQKQLEISDSIIKSHSYSLTDLLNQQTSIYFRQNGYGMVSSASFRGTSAAQTAVVWNGININSTLTGQTDFNTLLSANFSSLVVKSGGGSVLYGSGAIGGSIHLNQELNSNVDEMHNFQTGLGSFNTLETHYSYQNQFDDFQMKIALARRQSDNDFDIPDQNRRNENAKFNMNSLDAVLNYKLSKVHQLSYYSNFTFGEREFALVRPNDPRTKYDNLETRNLIEWRSQWKRFQSKLKFAYLTEEFSFFENLDRAGDVSSSNVETQWLQYEFWYQFSNIKLSAILNYQNAQAEGNQLTNAERQIAGASLLFQHQLTDKFNYEISLRQDVNDEFDNPFLFSIGTTYKLSERLKWRWHASKNYRIPTFNDLFWQNGGNLDLKPETAYQTEMGFDYQLNRLKLSLTGYYNSITDMIRWLPNENSLWQPINIDEVQTYGIEAIAGYSFKINDDSKIDFNFNYAYTISENLETGNQLIYVPFHKINTNAILLKGRWTLGLSHLYNGFVYTRTDNNPDETVPSFHLIDTELSYRFPKFLNSRLGFRVQNLFDLAYEAVDNRPMPGRAFSIRLTSQF